MANTEEKAKVEGMQTGGARVEPESKKRILLQRIVGHALSYTLVGFAGFFLGSALKYNNRVQVRDLDGDGYLDVAIQHPISTEVWLGCSTNKMGQNTGGDYAAGTNHFFIPLEQARRLSIRFQQSENQRGLESVTNTYRNIERSAQELFPDNLKSK